MAISYKVAKKHRERGRKMKMYSIIASKEMSMQEYFDIWTVAMEIPDKTKAQEIRDDLAKRNPDVKFKVIEYEKKAKNNELANKT